jgi:hypothetical protein
MGEVLVACQDRGLVEGASVLKAFLGLDCLGMALDAVEGRRPTWSHRHVEVPGSLRSVARPPLHEPEPDIDGTRRQAVLLAASLKTGGRLLPRTVLEKWGAACPM